jgi:hypothetical protein
LRPLEIRQRLTARVGEQTIGRAGQVQQVKSHAGSPAGCRPELVGGQACYGFFDILHGLQEGVRGRLQSRTDSLNRTSQPDFWLSGHQPRFYTAKSARLNG